MEKIRFLINNKKSKRHKSNKADTLPDLALILELVPDLTTPRLIKLRILCPSGRILVYMIDVRKRLAELKLEVLFEIQEEISGQPKPKRTVETFRQIRDLFPLYRFIRGEFDGRELNENQSINKLKITDESSLVLVARRNNVQKLMAQIKNTRAPNDEEVKAATSHIPVNRNTLLIIDTAEIFMQSNIHFDIRKIVISLAHMSAATIAVGPFAKGVINTLKWKLINKRDHKISSVKCLVDMGYTEEMAKYVMKINNGNYASALEWLIMHQNEPLREPKIELQGSISNISPSTIVTDNSIVENMIALTEIIRIYSHRELPLSEEAVDKLKEMGFNQEEINKALKYTSNNVAAAAEWLCGNRSPSLVELREGLGKDSPLFKQIMELPEVQMCLSNPKVFVALMAILDNESAIRVWHDTDVTNIIVDILQNYHEEKHMMGINQFYRNR